jgi:PhnB protein
MKKIDPYFNFPGNTEEAFNFYKSVFGGDFAMFSRFKDTPAASQVPASAGNGIMHVSYPVGGTMMMATDAIPEMGHKVTAGNQVQLCVEADSNQEADKIFNGLAKGGKVSQQIADMFWGSYWGSLTDKYGVGWMVNFTPAGGFTNSEQK